MVTEVATRPIMWNVSHPLNSVVMYGMFAMASIVALTGLYRHIELWISGKHSTKPSQPLLKKLTSLFEYGFFQKKVVSKPFAGIAVHLLIYTGFLALLFATTMVLLERDLGIPVFRGNFYLGITVASDVLGFGFIIGCSLALIRRLILKPDLIHTRRADTTLLWILILLGIQGFLLEGLRIAAIGDPWKNYSPIGNIVSYLLQGLPPKFLTTSHFIIWWFHAVTVFIGWALLPYSKLFHIFSSSTNLYFKNPERPLGALTSPGDIEQLMEKDADNFNVGTGNIKDYSWKQLLDLDACTSCGRCQEVCPAYNSGKPLSPKWLMLDIRSHAIALQTKGQIAPSKIPQLLQKLDTKLNASVLLASTGADRVSGNYYEIKGAFRGHNPEVQNSVRKIGDSSDAIIAGEVLDENVFWSCTTCMACMQACPVGIEHVDHIVSNRQHSTMMRGEVPKEAQQMLRTLENQSNPFGDSVGRTEWCKELNLRVIEPGDQVDYLYWVGCLSSFDPRKQKIARAVATLMTQAGLSFGILGDAEKCTGDPARRLGNELLFQMLAKENIATLSQVKFKYLVANCPHCFNTLKNEYKDFGQLGSENAPPIFMHHTQLVKELVQTGKIKVKPLSESSVTFHDPCYLGRGNGEYEAPRIALSALTNGNLKEMAPSKEKGMCCGAGGGHYFMDLKLGERINTIRTDQAAATGAKTIATGCPFCMQMMEDGVKLTNRDSQVNVKDVAELVLEGSSS